MKPRAYRRTRSLVSTGPRLTQGNAAVLACQLVVTSGCNFGVVLIPIVAIAITVWNTGMLEISFSTIPADPSTGI